MKGDTHNIYIFAGGLLPSHAIHMLEINYSCPNIQVAVCARPGKSSPRARKEKREGKTYIVSQSWATLWTARAQGIQIANRVCWPGVETTSNSPPLFPSHMQFSREILLPRVRSGYKLRNGETKETHISPPSGARAMRAQGIFL